MYLKIDHIGIAVSSLENSIKTYCAGLGFALAHIEEVADQKTRVAILPIGDSRLELLEAMGEDSPIGRFINKRGEGLHHICFEVGDIHAELERLRAAGVRLIDDAPRRGAGDCLVAFVHPSATGGVLVELSQPVAPTSSTSSNSD